MSAIGLSNQDSSFFSVSSPDADLGSAIRPDMVKSIRVVETVGHMDQATIGFLDPQHALSRLFRFGMRMDLSWGYKAWQERLALGAANLTTLDSFTQLIQRRGLRLMVSTPSGAGNEDGTVDYVCNLVAMDWRGSNQSRSFSSGTRGQLVAQMMAELRIVAPVIDFQGQERTIDDSTAVFQWESTFAFLARLAYEWHAYFRLAYRPDGIPTGIFVDTGKVGQPGFIGQVAPGSAVGYKLDWMSGSRNVISYNWQSHEGESGTGDGTSVEWENGQPVFIRYVVQDEKVVAWRLNEDRLRKYLQGINDDAGPAAMASATRDLLSQQDFNEKVRQFFDMVSGNTAPEGAGLTVNCEMLGTPTLVPTMPVLFGEGFPEKIGRVQVYNPYGNDLNYFIREHVHTVDPNGYHSSIEVVDSFTMFTQDQARQ